MKSSNKLLIILIIVAIIIVTFIAITLIIYNSQITNFSNEIIEEKIDNNIIENNITSNTLVVPLEEKKEPEEEKIYGYDENAMQVASSYNGFPACGFLEISKTGLALPLLSNQTVKGMEYSCCMLYTTGTLNLSGNTYIVGHNFNNGTLFSNNKKLNIGDKFVLTGLYKNRLEYTIYNMFNTTADDTSYLTKNVDDGTIELTIQTCNNDKADTRLIIQAIHHIKK